MPKKFSGENSKAIAARVRKENIKIEKKAKDVAAKEIAYWMDDNKQAQRKLNRKQEEESKRLETLKRKQLNKQAYEDEIKSIVTSNKNFAGLASSSNHTTKVTLAQIEAKRQESIQKQKEEEELLLKIKNKLVIQNEASENLNHIKEEGEVATTINDAIKILSFGAISEIDMHPEKRLKCAYAAFEEYRLPQLKIEHPTFRLSQLKQLLKKEWMKSPENPLNKKILNIIR